MNHFAFHIALAESKRRILAPARLETRRQTVTIIFAALLAVGLTALTGYQVARRKRVEIALRKTEDRARLMSMLRQIALSASRAASVREALQEALPPVLEYTRWPLAAAWTVETWNDRERL